MMRRGMTLIELMTSLGVMSILVLAMGSSVMIASRTLPQPGGEAEARGAAARGWTVIAEDLRMASEVTITDGMWIDLTIPAANEENPDRIVRVGATAEQPDVIVRVSEPGPAGLLISGVSDVSFTRRLAARGDQRDVLRASFSIAGHAFVAEQRLLNERDDS
ncbi:MAG: type II secretion system protein [Planctomycetota bacterium]